MTQEITSATTGTLANTAATGNKNRPRWTWRQVWSAAQLVVAIVGTASFLGYLLYDPAPPRVAPAVPPSEEAPPVEIAGPNLLKIRQPSPLYDKLEVTTVQKREITDPVLTVSGRVAASLRPGDGKREDYWQFDSPELLTIYNDWQKARLDIAFAETQLQQVKKLAEARLVAQRETVARLEKLVAAGTDAVKDLAHERANLLQTELLGRKEIHEAETALRVARRNEAALARQLQMAGLEPEILLQCTREVDLVLAEVPEGLGRHVAVGQQCTAVFFGLPGETFVGRISTIAPVVSRERRSLRLLIVMQDPQDKLRPGMFAQIGLGTEPRHSLVVPADAVLHVGRQDYVLVAGESGLWRIVAVEVGEPHQGYVEVLRGLQEGERIIGSGAILLKPLLSKALRNTAPGTTTAAGD
jgi:cobalt-zinc-cadmium efflux system membrane fusion protein